MAVVVAMALPGCASYTHTPYVAGAVPAMLHPIAAETTAFAYPAHALPLAALDGAWADAGDYWVSRLSMRSTGAIRTARATQAGGPDPSGHASIEARYYQGNAPGAKPLVIVLPVWGVSTYPSQTITAGLRQQGEGGLNILQVEGDRLLFDWDALGSARDEEAFDRVLGRMVGRFVDTVIDIRRMVDWAETRPEIDARRIALIGFSMSAIVGSVALTNDPRIGFGVLVVGGADLHEILAACNGRIRSTRTALRERFGWSTEKFKAQLEGPLAAINPVRFAGRLDPDRVLIIEAAADTCIPESARNRFWRAMGRPERVSYQYDHRATFLAMSFLGGYDLQRQVYRFLDRTVAPRLVQFEAVHNDSVAP